MAEEDDVYAILQMIPLGYVTTYKAIGDLLGMHQRKVAKILKKNKKPIIIPCHRVVMSNGKLGGYTPFGKNAKKLILLAEGVKVQGDRIDPRNIIKDLGKFLSEAF
ncbi:MAG: MGMT family protein [Caldisphaeraceae archaeon]|nr:MGMT family protein [Caldisphaeraceae archaeon]